MMGDHIVDGQFQSDKYPTTPRGKVPLSVKDNTAQDLLWRYAQRRRAVDAEFAADLEACLQAEGYKPPRRHEGFTNDELYRIAAARIEEALAEGREKDAMTMGFLVGQIAMQEMLLPSARGSEDFT